MSKIDELIRELCPEGVEFKEIRDILKMKRGVRVVRKDLSGIGEIPVFQNSLTPLGYHTKSNNHANTTYIITAGAAGEIGYSKVDFWAADDCFTFVCPDNMSDRYLYHFLKTQQRLIFSSVRRASIPRLSRTVIEKIKVPVPPLEVQKEIVDILDKFTQLKAELSAELDARRMQYEYYRKLLLSTDESHESARQLTLGDVGKVSMCKRIFKDQTTSAGDIPFYKIGTFGKTPDSFIAQQIYDEYRKKYSFPKKGDILLSASGTIGRTVIYDGEDAYFQDSNIIWLDNDEKIVTNPFLFHIYKIVKWQTEGGTIQRLYNENLKKIKITVPSIDEQKRIVSILSNFETLVNDISDGLPAEISARRKQYEYYRTKLLTFQELSL